MKTLSISSLAAELHSGCELICRNPNSLNNH